MALPNLIHAVDITLERLDTSTTFYDPDAQEPVQAAARYTPVVVKGQPKWVSQKELETAGFGASDSVRGYVLFRYADLAAVGITLRKNDRITQQGHLVDEVYITRLEPIAHYGDQNGATLVKAWFTDRLPAKER